ncbi:hypothetical protein AU375_03975 [Methylobacterium radiotolerans]|nr:hypothetical protein AU375_03975 [Methylobacterium radiotolerans]
MKRQNAITFAIKSTIAFIFVAILHDPVCAQYQNGSIGGYQTTYRNSILEPGPDNCAPPIDDEGEAIPQRAVSLKKLLLAGRTPTNSIPGMTRLQGFINRKDDIIIFGATEKDQPELSVDDLIVALQKAFGRRYRPTGIQEAESAQSISEQNSMEESAISIDPKPEEMERLKTVKIGSKGYKQRYQEICKAPQQVVTYNLPRDSRAVKTLVEADYRMKLVNQGHLRLKNNIELPGTFSSNRASGSISGDEGESRETSDRFWFKINKLSYKADDDTFSISALQLMLDTEKTGEGLLGSKLRNPAAESFACGWTSRMAEIIKSEPIWRDMENIYRHFAIAQIYKSNLVKDHNHDEIRKLVLEWKTESVTVPDAVPGMSRITETKVKESNRQAILVRAVCGGVSLSLHTARKINFALPSSSVPEYRIYKAILVSRPDEESTAWDVKHFDNLDDQWSRFRNAESEKQNKIRAQNDARIAELAAKKEREIEDAKQEKWRKTKQFMDEVARGEHPELSDYRPLYYGPPLVGLIIALYIWSRKYRTAPRTDHFPPA